MIRFFAQHRTAANILMALLLMVGLVSVGNIIRSTFPKLPLTKLQVNVPYPGAASHEVNEAICLRLESAIDQVDQIHEYSCESRDNLASLVVEANEDATIDRLLADVRTEIDAIDDMPASSEPPIIRLLGTTEPVVSIAVYGDLPLPMLKDFSEDMKSKLQQLPGVSKAAIQGFSDRRLLIEADMVVLRSLGLSVSQLADMIRSVNQDVPAGELNSANGSMSLRISDEKNSPESLANLRIRLPGRGDDFRLGDIATITDTFEFPDQHITFDGKPAAIINIEKSRSEDALDVLATIKEFMAMERQKHPAMTMALTQNLSSLVADRLGMLVKNGFQGLILVILVLWLFFSAKHAFWVALGLPVSFAGAFFLMRMMNLQFDMMTLVALLIVIGIIVDDAIVIAENIASHRENGADPLSASVNGTLEVMPGVLSSFATTFAIFLPLAFLKGELGTILAAVPVVMLMTLFVSLVEAFLILPAHLSHSHLDSQRNRAQLWLDGQLNKWRDQVVVGVRLFVKWRYFGFGSLIGVLLLCVSLLASGLIGFTPLPELDNESIEARLLMPSGTPISVTRKRVADIVAGLETVNQKLTPEQPDGQPLVRHVTIYYGKNIDAYETGDHVATISVDLLSPEIRTHTSTELRSLWRDAVGELTDTVFLKYADPIIGPQGKPLELRLSGDNLAQLQSAGASLFDWLSQYDGVHSLSTDLRPGKTELQFNLLPGAQTLGVTSGLIAEQLRGAFNGVIAQEVQVGREKFEVVVRLGNTDRARLNTLDTFMLQTADGIQIPLSAVAQITTSRSYARLNRVNGTNTLTIEGLINADKASSAGVTNDTVTRFVPDWQLEFPDTHLSIQGETERAAETLGSIRQSFLLGFFAMFLILALQFKSYIEPVVVVIVIPLSLIGVILGHGILGYNLTMPSMLGFVSLAGIVVNDSILLVTFVEKRLGEGMELEQAVVQASRDRFRAILLTSITTVAGLLPLLLETSLQAKVVIPLAISLAFGLTTATLLVLFVIPAFYMVLHDFGLFHRHDELKTATA